MPLEYGFSIMYCDSKKLLCSVEALEDKVQIACASPCLDTPKSYRNYGEFMQSMINGELSAMFSVDAKGEIEKNQLPLLSTSEETKNSHISSEEFYNLSDEEAERYYAIGATRGTNFANVAEMEARYNMEIQEREEHRSALIEQRVAMLPESFKSYICMANPKEKNIK